MHTSRCIGNLSCHECPPPRMSPGHAHPHCHAHPLPCTPPAHTYPSWPCMPPGHTHTPLPHMPPLSGHACPPVNRMTEGVKHYLAATLFLTEAVLKPYIFQKVLSSLRWNNRYVDLFVVTWHHDMCTYMCNIWKYCLSNVNTNIPMRRAGVV